MSRETSNSRTAPFVKYSFPRRKVVEPTMSDSVRSSSVIRIVDRPPLVRRQRYAGHPTKAGTLPRLLWVRLLGGQRCSAEHHHVVRPPTFPWRISAPQRG